MKSKEQTKEPQTKKQKKNSQKNKDKKTKTKKTSGRTWVSTNIVPNDEREWERLDFLNNHMSPTRWFELIWDTNVIDHIVRETTNYAFQMGKHNFQTSNDEMKFFIAIFC